MTIPPDLEAQILRYHHVEKWRAGTIARQLRVHYDTVVQVLLQAGLSRNGPLIRRSQIEPYLPFIRETLARQQRARDHSRGHRRRRRDGHRIRQRHARRRDRTPRIRYQGASGKR